MINLRQTEYDVSHDNPKTRYEDNFGVKGVSEFYWFLQVRPLHYLHGAISFGKNYCS